MPEQTRSQVDVLIEKARNERVLALQRVSRDSVTLQIGRVLYAFRRPEEGIAEEIVPVAPYRGVAPEMA